MSWAQWAGVGEGVGVAQTAPTHTLSPEGYRVGPWLWNNLLLQLPRRKGNSWYWLSLLRNLWSGHLLRVQGREGAGW